MREQTAAEALADVFRFAIALTIACGIVAIGTVADTGSSEPNKK